MLLPPRQLDLFRTPPRRTEKSQSLESVTREAPAVPRTAVAPRTPPRQEVVESAKRLAETVAGVLGHEVQVLLSVHDNRSTMISFRREPPLLRLRVHHLFLEAPLEVARALADYAGRGNRKAGRVLDAYIAERQTHISSERKRPTLLNARGTWFDLNEILSRLNALYFQDTIRARIGWGRNSSKRRRKSIRLGVYDHRAREIRIHPALDKENVPLFFVEYIVFHEMLHQLFPSARDAGRHVHHPKAFRDRERAFPRYAAAVAWERANLATLLRH